MTTSSSARHRGRRVPRRGVRATASVTTSATAMPALKVHFRKGAQWGHARIVHKLHRVGKFRTAMAPSIQKSFGAFPYPTRTCEPRSRCLTWRPWRKGCPSRTRPTTANDEAIAKRAYELYLQRGSVPGHELDDWLEAEAELTSAAPPWRPHPEARRCNPWCARRSARGRGAIAVEPAPLTAPPIGLFFDPYPLL